MEERNGFLEFLASQTGRFVMTAVGVVIIFGTLMWAIGTESTAIAGIAFLVCAFFGWKALNRITPDIFLFMSITGWIIYFLIKGLLSIFIGVFVAPVQISNMICRAINNQLNS